MVGRVEAQRNPKAPVRKKYIVYWSLRMSGRPRMAGKYLMNLMRSLQWMSTWFRRVITYLMSLKKRY